VVGEFNDAFKNLTLSGIRVNLSVSEFVGGVRFSATNSKQVTPFFQALLGLGRTGGGGSMSGVNVGVSSNGAAFDFGGGADIKAGRKSAVRVAAGLRHLSSSLGNANEFYLKFGISFTTRR
jgi:hypothetical protein